MPANVSLSDKDATVHVVVTDAPVETMTDRQLLEELVISARELRVAIAGAGEALANHPMLKMLGGSLGSLLGGR